MCVTRIREGKRKFEIPHSISPTKSVLDPNIIMMLWTTFSSFTNVCPSHVCVFGRVSPAALVRPSAWRPGRCPPGSMFTYIINTTTRLFLEPINFLPSLRHDSQYLGKDFSNRVNRIESGLSSEKLISTCVRTYHERFSVPENTPTIILFQGC